MVCYPGFFKDAVKIGNIIKTAQVSNFCNPVTGLHQQPGRIAQPDLIERIDKSMACFRWP